MAKAKDFDSKVDERYEAMKPAFGELDEMTDSMLRTYCTVCVQIDEANERLKSEGFVVITEKGPRENLLVNIVHKLNADKARYFAPLKRVLNAREQASEDDLFAEADDFMGL